MINTDRQLGHYDLFRFSDGKLLRRYWVFVDALHAAQELEVAGIAYVLHSPDYPFSITKLRVKS
jgi:hypothetical protein